MARIVLSDTVSVAASGTNQVIVTRTLMGTTLDPVSAGFNVNDGGGVLIPLLLQPEFATDGTLDGFSLTVKNTDSVSRDAELYVIFE